MSTPNVKPSIQYPYKAQVAPQSMAAAATATSGWIAVGTAKWAKILALVGAGAGTLAVKLEQATSSGGAGAKDLATAAQTGITALATGAAQADVSIDQYLDVDGGFGFIRLSGTMTGGAGTLASASLELGPAAWQA